jgi:hypothetical protein
MYKIYIIVIFILLILLSLVIYYSYNQRKYIVVSLTTSPTRIKYIKPIIDNLFNQTMKPNKIVLNIPYIFKRTNEKYKIPKYLYNEDIIINRIDDIGPITKILPTFKLKFPINSLIISIDDDIKYGLNMIEVMYKYYEKNPNTVLTSTSFLEEYMVAGYSGIGYPYKIFKNIKIDLNIPKICMFSDDFVLSNTILNNNIKIKIIKDEYTYIPYDYGLKEDALHKGAVIKNDDYDVHIKNYKICAKYYDNKNDLNNMLKIWLD